MIKSKYRKRPKYLTADDKFWARTNKKSDNECWLWLGTRGSFSSKTGKGNGKFTHDGEHYIAHRYSYELHIGKIPENTQCIHSCSVPHCVNPKHLFLGTQSDNVQNKTKKGRGNIPKGEDNFHSKLTTEQVKEIRKLYKDKTHSQFDLQDMFGINQSCINLVIKNKTYIDKNYTPPGNWSQKKLKFSDEVILNIHTQYINREIFVSDMFEKTGVRYVTFNTRCKKLGLKLIRMRKPKNV